MASSVTAGFRVRIASSRRVLRVDDDRLELAPAYLKCADRLLDSGGCRSPPARMPGTLLTIWFVQAVRHEAGADHPDADRVAPALLALASAYRR